MKITDYNERKRRGSPDFPIQYYYVDKSNTQYIMKAHWHKEFEIVRILKGNFKIFLDNVEYLLKQGDVIFVESGSLHRGEPENCVYECIVFDLNMLTKQQNDVAQKYISPIFNSTAGINCLMFSCKSSIGVIIDALFRALREKKQYYELEVYSLLYKTFADLYSAGNIVDTAKTPHSHQAENITRLLDWIEKNFTEQISLEKLSEISGFSKKYLCRIFKEYTSKTLVEYINELRIENACYEISKKGKSITNSAFDSGFNDLSYFCKTFKKYKNITPNEYKKNANLLN